MRKLAAGQGALSHAGAACRRGWRGRSSRARTSSATRCAIHCSIEYVWRTQRMRSLAEKASLMCSMKNPSMPLHRHATPSGTARWPAASSSGAGMSGAAQAHEAGSGERCYHVSGCCSPAAAHRPSTSAACAAAAGPRGRPAGPAAAALSGRRARPRQSHAAWRMPETPTPSSSQPGPILGGPPSCRLPHRQPMRSVNRRMRMRMRTLSHALSIGTTLTLRFGGAVWRTAHGQALLQGGDQEIAAGCAEEGLQVHGARPVAGRTTEKPLVQLRRLNQVLQQATARSRGLCRLAAGAAGAWGVGRCAPGSRCGKGSFRGHGAPALQE